MVTSMGKTGQKVGTREISQCDLVMNGESLVSHVKHRRNEGAGKNTWKTSQKSIIQMRKTCTNKN